MMRSTTNKPITTHKTLVDDNPNKNTKAFLNMFA